MTIINYQCTSAFCNNLVRNSRTIVAVKIFMTKRMKTTRVLVI